MEDKSHSHVQCFFINAAIKSQNVTHVQSETPSRALLDFDFDLICSKNHTDWIIHRAFDLIQICFMDILIVQSYS